MRWGLDTGLLIDGTRPLAGDEGIRPGLLQDGTQENLDSLAKDGQLYERSGDYYTMESIEDMLDGIEEE